MRELTPDLAFATAYDVIYREPQAFYDAQLGFARARFGGAPARLLDAGCGTGRHVIALARSGHTVVGLDISPAMIARAGRKLAGAGLPAGLVRGDLRALPLNAQFDGILCLESPLAYFLAADDLARALAGFWRVLKPGGLVIADVLDYAGTLGPDGIGTQTARFSDKDATITVRETHRCDPAAALWRMRQEFTITGRGEPAHGEIEHLLSMRTADEYGEALETAGFVVEDVLEGFPGAPPELAGELRMIFLARKR
jgi:SAM-dependent methyltransferase